MKRMLTLRGIFTILLVAGLAAFSLAAVALATPPGRVNFQGTVQDSAGTPLNGPVTMVFRLYDDSAAGVLLWQETYDPTVYTPAVTVSAGLFTVALGDLTHRSAGSEPTFQGVFANHGAVYLSMQAGADPEMTPRIQVVASPFTLNAAKLEGRQASEFAAAAHLHPGTDITSAVANATNATHATSADTATNAGHATSADSATNATNATNATHATSADSATNATNATNAVNADTVDSKHAGDFIPSSSEETFLNTSATAQTKAGKLILAGSADYGIDASGSTGGGSFHNAGSGVALVGIGDTGIEAIGNAAGGYFKDLDSTGEVYVGIGDIGIEAFGYTAGGYFGDPDSSGYAYVGYGDYGIKAFGNTAGVYGEGLIAGSTAIWGEGFNSGAGMAGYFHGKVGIGTATPGFPLTFASSTGDKISLWGQSGAHYGFGVQGGLLQIHSDTAASDIAFGYGTSAAFTEAMRIGGNGNVGIGGAPFSSSRLYVKSTASGVAYLGDGDNGISAFGNAAGGFFQDLNASGWANVGYGTYKINGTGTVSFVQNHPTEKDKVIVYACPEGDEVAVYTRGTAKLVNGEARVQLGETFKWVTNPDIGLTAHLTPKSKDGVLYVESVSTSELVVRSVTGFAQDAAFDYLVYGLRIGFEESSIVQEKQQESYIPSFKDHRERYAKYPELRAFNSLERFKGMESSVRGVEPASIDLSRAKALKDAIHEYDPATDPPVEKLFGNDHGQNPSGMSRPSGPSPISAPQPAHPASRPVPPSDDNPANGASEAAGGGVPIVSNPALPCFPSSETVEPGDVVVMDPSRDGHVLRCSAQADPMVMGIAAGLSSDCGTAQPGEEISASVRVPVATSGVVSCKADATLRAIRRGDLLVASPNPGHAMRADNPAQGTVIGKALEPLASGTALIKVLVMFR